MDRTLSKAPDCLQDYLGFDDRKFILIGIPVVALMAAVLFCTGDLRELYLNFIPYYLQSILFTSMFWFYNRFMVIGLRKKFKSLDETLKRNLIQAGMIALGYPVIVLLGRLLLVGIAKLIGDATWIKQGHPMGFLSTILIIIMIVAIYEAIYFFQQYRAAYVDKERLQTEHANTQLTALRNQVNPHFLFNSLNTLMSLIPRDAKHAHSYLSKLSSFYRYSVSEQEELAVSLSQEIEMVKLYADLVRERFGDGLDIDIVDADLSEASILPMTLQLLVENAVKHNIVSKDEPLKVLVYEKEGYIHVENNIQHRISETGSTGMGLKNIKERYQFVTDKEVLIQDGSSMFKVSIPLLHTRL